MAEASKKPNAFVRFFKRIGKFFRELRSELKKVVWPTVLLCVLAVGLFVWIFDGVAGLIVNGIIGLVK